MGCGRSQDPLRTPFYAPSFFVLLAIAGLIGAVGILTNSQILIVGAMVVGPEYNAIMGVALGIVVAILAGIVGVVSLTESRASALIGVFISVTTIPAAADIALSTAYASWTEAWGSAVQLVLNVAVLITIGALGLRLQRIMWRPRARAAQPAAGSARSASGPSGGGSG